MMYIGDSNLNPREPKLHLDTEKLGACSFTIIKYLEKEYGTDLDAMWNALGAALFLFMEKNPSEDSYEDKCKRFYDMMLDNKNLSRDAKNG